MATCGSCGHESARIRTVFAVGSSKLPDPKDECPHCAPHSFEAIKDPSTQKIWIGPEYNPNAYEKRYDEGEPYYIAKPEFTAEEEAKVARQATDELEAQERAAAKKRLERRTDPMSEAELLAAIAKARQYSDWLAEAAAEDRRQAEKAELAAWVSKATS